MIAAFLLCSCSSTVLVDSVKLPPTFTKSRVSVSLNPDLKFINTVPTIFGSSTVLVYFTCLHNDISNILSSPAFIPTPPKYGIELPNTNISFFVFNNAFNKSSFC